jgi:hypothetical protein
MRVFVAGANPTHVEALLQTLPATLPPSVRCAAWAPGMTTSDAERTPDDVVLLLGLDLENTTHPAQTLADEALRAQLMTQGVAFQVVYGDANQRLQEAQYAVAKRLRVHSPELAANLMREEITPRWQGLCDACSDPDCEHRLFRRLVRPNDSLE